MEALRRQGLAKRGSQAYQEFEKQSLESQTAYETAARDLEGRKAKTSEYKYQGTKEISPVDALYLDHQKWRKDQDKQNKEALGLFDSKPEHIVVADEGGRQENTKFSNQDGYQKWENTDSPVGDVNKNKKEKGEQVKSNCACVVM